MQFALDVAPLGELADARELVRLAVAAEASGWDGLSTWDVLGTTMGGAADPFVALAAAATQTQHLALIASVVVLPRRRPQLVAQAAATLDLLSGGRLVLGIGAGGDAADFTAFGEDWDAGPRIARMHEAAGIVDALLRGETLGHHGSAYAVNGVALGPRPAQVPRPPMWLGAVRRAGVLQAARWDGWIAVSIEADGVSLAMPPHVLGEHVGRIEAARVAAGLADRPFDVAVFGQAGLGGFTPADYAAAGATWWLESVSPMRGPLDELARIAAAGPPRG